MEVKIGTAMCDLCRFIRTDLVIVNDSIKTFHYHCICKDCLVKLLREIPVIKEGLGIR